MNGKLQNKRKSNPLLFVNFASGIRWDSDAVRIPEDLVFCSGAYQGGASLVRLAPDGNGGIQANEVFHLLGRELQVMHGGMVLVGGHTWS